MQHMKYNKKILRKIKMEKQSAKKKKKRYQNYLNIP